MLLENKIALVTGAAHGLGRGIACALAAEGAAVAVADIRTEALLETARLVEAQGRRALALQLDVTSPESITAGMATLVAEWGQLDLLVNNAGVIKMNEALAIEAQGWDLTFAVNVKGIMLCTQVAVKQMIQQGRGGSIVNIASNAGKVGFPNMADYNASKAAVISLTRTLAAEFAPHGINVNAVCPGAVNTAMLLGVAEWICQNNGSGDPHELVKTFAPRQLGRLIEPEEVGAVVAFLASDKAKIIRGQAINVDGGDTAY